MRKQNVMLATAQLFR